MREKISRYFSNNFRDLNDGERLLYLDITHVQLTFSEMHFNRNLIFAEKEFIREEILGEKGKKWRIRNHLHVDFISRDRDNSLARLTRSHYTAITKPLQSLSYDTWEKKLITSNYNVRGSF